MTPPDFDKMARDIIGNSGDDLSDDELAHIVAVLADLWNAAIEAAYDRADQFGSYVGEAIIKLKVAKP